MKDLNHLKNNYLIDPLKKVIKVTYIRKYALKKHDLYVDMHFIDVETGKDYKLLKLVYADFCQMFTKPNPFVIETLFKDIKNE